MMVAEAEGSVKMDVMIRLVKKADISSLARLADDEWASKLAILASSFAKCDGIIERCYVAEKSNELVGFIYGFVLPSGLLLPELLYVRSEYRGKGIGTQLMEYLEKKSGCTSSMIFYNTALHDYYAKRGYIVGENLEIAMKNLVPAEKYI